MKFGTIVTVSNVYEGSSTILVLQLKHSNEKSECRQKYKFNLSVAWTLKWFYKTDRVFVLKINIKTAHFGKGKKQQQYFCTIRFVLVNFEVLYYQ